MSKKLVVCLVLVSLVALGGQAFAEMCTIDDVPAATLLLPYFEVDLNDPNGINTLFSINNASAAPALAHVTFWTDMSVPVLDFDVYLTGYDVQTISIRDILAGNLPQTLIDSLDGNDTVSPDGPDTGTALGNPQDGDFPGTSGPCVSTYAPLQSSFVNGHLIPALTGGSSSLDGCVGTDYGDNHARGYVTVDSVSACSLDFPVDSSYFTNTAAFTNILWGDYFYVDNLNNFAQGETLVHIEACNPADGYEGYVGNGAGRCPFAAGDFTFYHRYVSDTGVDQREGLASQFAVRYLQGGDFDGGTNYVVWRDSMESFKTAGPDGTCPAEAGTDWYPLNQSLVVAFDEEENGQQRCFTTSDVSPPTGGQQTCFPIESGSYNVVDSQVPGSQSLAPSSPFGWMYLDLNLSGNQPSQAWVTAVMSALGRFSVGFDAIKLDTVCDTPLI